MARSNRDKYGEYIIEVEGQILTVTVRGAMGVSLTKKYVNHILEVSAQFNGECWGYLVNGIDFEASAYDADEIIIDCYKQCLERNCVVDAYIANSALAKNQIDRIRKATGMTSAIDDHLFDNKEQAYAYMNKAIADIQALQLT